MIDFNNYIQLIWKFSFVLGSILYLIFAFVVVKQVTTMSRNVTDKFNTVLIIFSYFHLIFALLLVLFTLFL